MKNRTVLNRLMIVVCVILILLLVLSNIAWLTFYLRERRNLRHSIMPVTQGDYYQEQLALINNYELLRNEIKGITEYENQGTNKDSNLDETDYQQKNQKKIEVPFIKQNPDYPNGCESVSAVISIP